MVASSLCKFEYFVNGILSSSCQVNWDMPIIQTTRMILWSGKRWAITMRLFYTNYKYLFPRQRFLEWAIAFIKTCTPPPCWGPLNSSGLVKDFTRNSSGVHKNLNSLGGLQKRGPQQGGGSNFKCNSSNEVFGPDTPHLIWDMIYFSRLLFQSEWWGSWNE